MPNALDGLFSFTKNFLRRDNGAIGIDIGTSSVKVVELRKEKGRAVLSTYGEIALGPYGGGVVGQAVNVSNDDIVKATQELFQEANVVSRKAGVAIPLRSSLLKVIEIPQVENASLDQIVSMEARKYVPVSISEVALDWWPLPNDDLESPIKDSNTKSKKEVLFVAVHKDTMSRMNELTTKLKLTSPTLELETFSMLRALAIYEVDAMAILDLGATSSKLSIIDGGVVRGSHVVSKGGQDVTLSLGTSMNLGFAQAEKLKREAGLDVGDAVVPTHMLESRANARIVMASIVEYIFYECNRAITDYQRRYGRVISKIILTGGGALLRGVSDMAQKNFEAEVVLGHAFEKADSPAFLAEVLNEAGPEFSVATGLALRALQD